MSEHAYDITYLLDIEPVKLDVPERGTVRKPLAAVPASVSALQEAMARELLQADEAHEALIQQFLRMAGQSFSGAGGQ
ncbi:hypothetical protein ACPPVV_04470 [Rhodanobacter sp. Col0626]|uniref:hypothetical protein n=1 Tax=Rhodanobacter sp. Col0626 TaxID=3415679 RepID=UPI003CEBFAFA